jgi:hypothetical protein
VAAVVVVAVVPMMNDDGRPVVMVMNDDTRFLHQILRRGKQSLVDRERRG